MKYFAFPAGNETLAATIYSDGNSLPNTISLHGAGNATQERIAYLAPLFREKGFPMLTFDFSGHGESTGELSKSSLAKRITEAQEAMKLLDPDQKITVIASSMGAHVALELMHSGRVENLVLFCPAIYSDAAVPLQFDRGFTDEIRKPDSWKHSSLFTELGKFYGRLIIVIGEEDNVIPKEVISQLIASATHVKHKELIFVPGAGHEIHAWLKEHPEDLDRVMQKIFDHIIQ